MATTINASTSSGLVSTADTSGVLQLQTANTTAVSISAAQVVNFTNAPTVGTLTSGRVTYAGTSGVLQDSANLVWDNTNARLGINNSSPSYTFDGTGSFRFSSTGQYQPIFTNNTTRAFVVSRASIPIHLIGFVIQNSAAAATDVTGGLYLDDNTGNLNLVNNYSPASYISFSTNATERARIDLNGMLLGQTAQTTTERLGVTFTGNNDGAYVYNVSASPTGSGITSNFGSPTGTNTNTCFLYKGRTAGADRFLVYGNGGIANYSANNVNLSDRREKTNFAPAKSYLDIICAIPVQTFKYIDQSEDDTGLTLGVVAQDVQAVAPELIFESDWGTKKEPKVRLSIYQTDLQYALMKCIQEQQIMIQSLTDRVNQLEAK